ncbi:MAG: S41 family peptidase [Treponemataceae bacterium]|nr:S41 family peptidase [Treponemataceae bacterium]
MKQCLFSKLYPMYRRAVSAASFFIISILASQCFAQSAVESDHVSNFQYLKTLNSVFDFVQRNYVDEIDPKTLYEGAMKGLMNSLGDPYTSYLDTDTIRDLSDTTTGNFGGVGLTISKPIESTPEKPAYVEVASPIEDSPGAKAGILAGDCITEINGKPTPEMTMDGVLSLLRGEIGEPVSVTIRRGKNVTFTVELVRALIEVPTVKFGMIGRTGYLRIIQFTPDTPARVQEALDFFKTERYENMIIDLRDNPGGLITSVIDVANKFIDNGPIVSTKSRISYENAVFNAAADKTEVRNMPIIVLINRGSASAAEILAGALKDNHLAYLVGQRSYGKGSVQQVIPLGDDEAIKLTMARYYTPSDTNIDKIGIPPDLEVLYPELTEEDERAYSALMEANVIAEHVEAHPEMTEADIARYAAELRRDYPLSELLLRRLVRIQLWRKQPSHLYDLDYDIQLNAALDILRKNADFRALVRSTKTLKELQLEAEAEDGELNAAEAAAEK